MSVMAFIQARLGSTRLPGKVLLDLGGKPVLERVVERVAKAVGIGNVVVLTTLGFQDLALVRFCAERGILVFCGSEGDVLDRFYQAAKILKPDHIIRITADCPVMDPAIITEVVERHLSSGVDYTSNTLIERYPDGEDVEVIRMAALRLAWERAELASEREHVTPYIRKHPEMFARESVICKEDHSGQRWTLDNEPDYVFLTALYRELGPIDECFGMDAILKLISLRPDLASINSGIVRNEGLLKSLREDSLVKERE